jgi:hypothetical protein
VIFIFATEYVAAAPVFDTVSVVVLSIAQQEGRTLTIVAKETVLSSVVAAIVVVASAPGISIPFFKSETVTTPAAVLATVPLKVT